MHDSELESNTEGVYCRNPYIIAMSSQLVCSVLIFVSPTQVWKARVSGYEELAKKFRLADPADSREFTQYEGYLKKMAVDANAVAQESALTTIINYVDNAPNAEK